MPPAIAPPRNYGIRPYVQSTDCEMSVTLRDRGVPILVASSPRISGLNSTFSRNLAIAVSFSEGYAAGQRLYVQSVSGASRPSGQFATQIGGFGIKPVSSSYR